MNRARNLNRTVGSSRNAFTLIELLVVIAIIAILASISVPVISRALESAKKAQAKTEISALESALRAYFNEYSKFPHGSGSADRTYIGDNRQLLNVLRAIDSSEGNSGHANNPRRIVFLEVAERSLSKSEGGVEQNPNFIDPWERPYNVALDTNFDNSVTTSSGHGVIENRRYAVWSTGPAPDNLNSHIVSWK